ncbi:MAG: sigma-54 dependent transcriptional regulator [Bdellovibrionales bacterium]|nr:sigma-54 dependent transcriptional regulator [Bdellovibrionales bacterium]
MLNTTSNEIKLFLLDDSDTDLALMEMYAKNCGFSFSSFTDPFVALEKIHEYPNPCLLISDISMPNLDGFEIMKRLNLSPNNCLVLFISGQRDIEFPIQAMRMGALDYIPKPINIKSFDARIRKAMENLSARYELQTVKDQIFSGRSFDTFVGQSESIKNVFSIIMRVSSFDSTVLITGESGVGKERVARAIHERSPRASKEFVAVNCASLPENLIESELFGYSKGSFTGAEKDSVGLFQVAHEGTIFLDEIAELPLHLQAKLLRVLQEKEIRPVGAKKSVKIDIRVICATHRNLEELVINRQFREDLYFRLNVIPIHVPPLRERRQDLKSLVPFFMERLNSKWGLEKSVSPELWKFFDYYNFPGNVRELENMLERAYILSRNKIISNQDLLLQPGRKAVEGTFFNLDQNLPSLKEIELSYVREVIKRSQTKDEAAQTLAIGRKTLYRKEFEIDQFFAPTKND